MGGAPHPRHLGPCLSDVLYTSLMPWSWEHSSETHLSGPGPRAAPFLQQLKADSERVTIFTFGCQDFWASSQALKRGSFSMHFNQLRSITKNL